VSEDRVKKAIASTRPALEAGAEAEKKKAPPKKLSAHEEAKKKTDAAIAKKTSLSF